MSNIIASTLSSEVIACFFTTYNALGFGFSESIYANALSVELRSRNMDVLREVPIEVVYRGVPVGVYRLDITVNGRILIEIKATKALCDADERQLLSYLKATNIEIGYLLHFGPTPEFQRRIYTNDRK